MKIEDLIVTPEIQRSRRQNAFNRAQYFCFGVSGAALAGSADVWWKTLHVAVLFLTIAVILGVAKMASCRRRSRRTYVANPLPLPRKV